MTENHSKYQNKNGEENKDDSSENSNFESLLMKYWRNFKISHNLKNPKERKEKTKIIKENKEENMCTLSFSDGRSFNFPIYNGTMGPASINMSTLYKKTGILSYDPGLMSTACCSSAITYIDGEKSILLHRGYRIEDLVENSDFEEITYLLLYGELPNGYQKRIHSKGIKKHRMIHEKLIKFYSGFRYDAHPMAIMVGVVGALSAFYHDTLDIKNLRHRLLASYRLLGKIPTIAAIAYKTSIGEPIVYPLEELSFSENLLYMMFSLPSKKYKLVPIKAKALELFLILHADHEQNASTSTVRISGSSLSNPYACISSGIATLWGPAHGGANEAVINMLTNIGKVKNIPIYINKAKDPKDSFRLMGFGHRVYKSYDPRAKIMKKMCHTLIKDLKISDPHLYLAMELEEVVKKDEYFIKRKLFPNVDFYSGIVLKAIGIPLSMFTVLFAVSRTIGWISNWKEMIEDSNQRIMRPRQVYIGSLQRNYIPMDERVKEKDIIENEESNLDEKNVQYIEPRFHRPE